MEENFETKFQHQKLKDKEIQKTAKYIRINHNKMINFIHT